MSPSDASFVYQFGVGFVFFAAGLVLAFRTGSWSFRRGERNEAALLVAMFLGYLALQGFLQFVGPRL